MPGPLSFHFSRKAWLRFFMLVLILITSYLILGSISSQTAKVTAKSGKIDLANHDLLKTAISLDGEWKFHWKQLLTPNSNLKETETHFALPRVWNGFEHNNTKLPAYGYATYQLEIKMHPNLKDEDIAIYIPFIHSSYAIYLQDKLVAEAGKVGKSSDEYTPVARTHIIPIKENAETLLLTIHVANYAYAMGGIWQSPSIGSRTIVQSYYDRQLGFDIFIFGCLFLMSIYHIALYYLWRRVKSNLYFGLLCFFFAIKNLFSGVVFFYSMWPNASYELGLKCIHISIFASALFLWLFLRELFKKEFPLLISKILFIGSSLCILITLLFPSQVYSQLLVVFWGILGIVILFIIRGIYFAVLRKREGALLILTGIVCLILTVAHDLAIDFNLIKNVYISGFGFLIFIFSQALLLAVKFTNSFQKVENLTDNLMETNKSFSRFVPSEFLSYLNKESITQVNLGDSSQQEMTVFFSDIRAYTTLSESMSPQTNFAFINDYLGRVVHYIHENGGLVNQYLGDGILAVFKNNPQNAIKAATQIQNDISNITRLGGYELQETLRNGIGIHSGSLILGMMGTERRMSIGVISDTVNTTSRIEGLTKFFGTQIIISEASLCMVKDTSELDYRFLGKVQLIGKIDTLKIYEILNELPSEQRALKLSTREHFENGLEAYFIKDFKSAIALFQKVALINPEDKAASIYLKNSQHYINVDALHSWQGIIKMEIK